MAATEPLKDLELVDCAKANAKQGIETAANLCGYGKDLNSFKSELRQACDRIGVKFNELTDLITDEPSLLQTDGLEIAPNTSDDLHEDLGARV
jgi:hypothetical protein